LGGAQTLWRATVPQLYVDTDRDKAKTLGVPIDDVYNALAGTLGTYYVNDFNKYGRTWQVLMSADPAYRKRPDDIGGVYVRSAKGEMIPLSSLATVRYTSGPDALDRFNNLPAVKIIGQAAPGFSSGPGNRQGRADRRRSAAARFHFRLGRHVVPGETLGRRIGLFARAGGDHGVPDPVRAIRAMVAAALRAAGASVRHVRRARRGPSAGH
jgi:multidrug efflux pump subunit AcrB